ncbi:hypothetical protein MVES_001707 [Malassezia vespertilionis]|uniref:RRM domain-containing protein n=1 Tax=Malassezia vespertilionis TaxID=2020962 RepID=A0A2N1JD09_9BASI|nr:hypothetical protein MVES_001707 [Malassezia vespertilionis]
MSSGTPNNAVYVRNINTKLYTLFGSYGKILDVVATRADGMRGQAFVVFRDLQSAASAMRGLEGFSFYDSPLSMEYARKKSYASIVYEHGEEALLNPTLMNRLEEGAPQTGRVTFSHAQAQALGQEKKRLRDDQAANGDQSAADAPNARTTDESRPLKTQRVEVDAREENAGGDDDAMEMGDSDEE